MPNPNNPFAAVPPVLDPDDHSLEIFYDASGRRRRRAASADTISRGASAASAEEQRRDATLARRIAEHLSYHASEFANAMAVEPLVFGNRNTVANLQAAVAHLIRKIAAFQSYVATYQRGWLDAHNAGGGIFDTYYDIGSPLTQGDFTITTVMPTTRRRATTELNQDQIAHLVSVMGEYISQIEAKKAGYSRQLDELCENNEYCTRQADGSWVFRSCAACGIQGDSERRPLTRVLVHDVARLPRRVRDTQGRVAVADTTYVDMCAEHATLNTCCMCSLQGCMFDVQMRYVMLDRHRDGQRMMCSRCYGQISRYCDDCGNRTGSIAHPLIEDPAGSGEFFCEECAPNVRTHARIRQHGYEPATITWLHVNNEPTPGPRNGVSACDQLYFGMEIECENTQHNIENGEGAKIAVDSGLFYVERDGSISDGFEMVSHPFTWAWLLANHSEKLKALEKLGKMGFSGFKTETCGMHVHMSKEALPSNQVYKLLRLIYGNPDFISMVSRRKPQHLNQWANPNLNYTPQAMSKAAKEKYIDGKYRALNLSKNHTAEIRIFRSTLSPAGVMMNLEFCKSALDFTSKCSVREASNVREFVESVFDGRVHYPHLCWFLGSKTRLARLSQMGLLSDSRFKQEDGRVDSAKKRDTPMPTVVNESDM